MGKRAKRRKKEVRNASPNAPPTPTSVNNPQSEDPTASEPRQEAKSGKTKISFVEAAIIFLATSVGLAAAVNYFSVNPRVLYISAAMLCLLLAWFMRRQRWLRWALIPLYFLIVFGTHKYIQASISKPGLILVLNAYGRGYTRLDLTNSFFLHGGTDTVPLRGIGGGIAVPFSHTDPSATLIFSVRNDPKATAEGANAVLGIAKYLPANPSELWDTMDATDEQKLVIGYRLPSIMLPRETYSMPPIEFRKLTNGAVGVVTANIRAKDFSDTHCSFWLYFIESTNLATQVGPVEPVINGTNVSFQMRVTEAVQVPN